MGQVKRVEKSISTENNWAGGICFFPTPQVVKAYSKYRKTLIENRLAQVATPPPPRARSVHAAYARIARWGANAESLSKLNITSLRAVLKHHHLTESKIKTAPEEAEFEATVEKLDTAKSERSRERALSPLVLPES